ncbi:Na(+)/H(+) antiporter subunit C [Modestobacter roseus]|uniref:Multisubunit sodium/proton antiporter, MrpC subunit (TC 2.A.63.1) n=1 Tax=Modestobacter roseus TaxID=1181884 RepID=A0A562IXY3_9ACTN|nr:Na(+)/H(+) antiporter subunit C [Modestobacter roseus]MQA33919.1 Na(+)/H(+) antiporter subunit C [Modestobacter roseus]TWH75465.1 multisubunit sodium/proton antiporter, MrpC subunit (TC 2.A.63.1) [Modestobacter roseus]
MTPTVVLPVVIGGLYAAGVYLLLDRSLTRVILGFILLGNATNLLLLSASGAAMLAPVFGYAEAEEMSDPLPQALVLTAIVITFGVTAFLLAMVHRSWQLVRQEVIETDEEDRRVATREGMDADDMDPDDLPTEDRPAGKGNALHSDVDVEERLAQRYAGVPSDDITLPPTRRRRR